MLIKPTKRIVRKSTCFFETSCISYTYINIYKKMSREQWGGGAQ